MPRHNGNNKPKGNLEISFEEFTQKHKGYDYCWQSFQQSALTKTIYWMEWGLIVDRGLTVDSYSVEYPLDYIEYDEYKIFYMTGVYNQDVFYPIEIIPTACV